MSKPLKPDQLMQLHSEELQQVVGRPPGSIVRWGTLVIFLALIIMFLISVFVKYADVLSCAFTLAASNAPKSVIAHTDGKLQTLFVREKDTVLQGQVLAYIESNASHEQVIKLSEDLQRLWELVQQNKWEGVSLFKPSSYRNLGELQSAYQQFIATYIQLDAYLQKGMYVQKKKLLTQELNNLNSLNENYLLQQEVYKRDLDIAAQHFDAITKLHEQDVVAKLEYKDEESKYLNKKVPLQNLNLTIINNKNAIANKEQEQVQLDQQYNDQKSAFLQALNTLTSSTEDWKKHYLLVAPVTGSVTLPTLLQVNQDVKVSQELFYITPAGAGFYGEMNVPQENFGKLQTGQPVLITLSGYPYQEYGKLDGKVSFISNIPNTEKQYYVAVTFNNGLVTDRNMPVNFQNGLTGTAEIVTQKTRIIYKLLYTLREVLYKPKTVSSRK